MSTVEDDCSRGETEVSFTSTVVTAPNDGSDDDGPAILIINEERLEPEDSSANATNPANTTPSSHEQKSPKVVNKAFEDSKKNRMDCTESTSSSTYHAFHLLESILDRKTEQRKDVIAKRGRLIMKPARKPANSYPEVPILPYPTPVRKAVPSAVPPPLTSNNNNTSGVQLNISNNVNVFPLTCLPTVANSNETSSGLNVNISSNSDCFTPKIESVFYTGRTKDLKGNVHDVVFPIQALSSIILKPEKPPEKKQNTVPVLVSNGKRTFTESLLTKGNEPGVISVLQNPTLISPTGVQKTALPPLTPAPTLPLLNSNQLVNNLAMPPVVPQTSFPLLQTQNAPLMNAKGRIVQIPLVQPPRLVNVVASNSLLLEPPMQAIPSAVPLGINVLASSFSTCPNMNINPVIVTTAQSVPNINNLAYNAQLKSSSGSVIVNQISPSPNTSQPSSCLQSTPSANTVKKATAPVIINVVRATSGHSPHKLRPKTGKPGCRNSGTQNCKTMNRFSPLLQKQDLTGKQSSKTMSRFSTLLQKQDLTGTQNDKTMFKLSTSSIPTRQKPNILRKKNNTSVCSYTFAAEQIKAPPIHIRPKNNILKIHMDTPVSSSSASNNSILKKQNVETHTSQSSNSGIPNLPVNNSASNNPSLPLLHSSNPTLSVPKKVLDLDLSANNKSVFRKSTVKDLLSQIRSLGPKTGNNDSKKDEQECKTCIHEKKSEKLDNKKIEKQISYFDTTLNEPNDVGSLKITRVALRDIIRIFLRTVSQMNKSVLDQGIITTEDLASIIPHYFELSSNASSAIFDSDSKNSSDSEQPTRENEALNVDADVKAIVKIEPEDDNLNSNTEYLCDPNIENSEGKEIAQSCLKFSKNQAVKEKPTTLKFSGGFGDLNLKTECFNEHISDEKHEKKEIFERFLKSPKKTSMEEMPTTLTFSGDLGDGDLNSKTECFNKHLSDIEKHEKREISELLLKSQKKTSMEEMPPTLTFSEGLDDEDFNSKTECFNEHLSGDKKHEKRKISEQFLKLPKKISMEEIPPTLTFSGGSDDGDLTECFSEHPSNIEKHEISEISELLVKSPKNRSIEGIPPALTFYGGLEERDFKSKTECFSENLSDIDKHEKRGEVPCIEICKKRSMEEVPPTLTYYGDSGIENYNIEHLPETDSNIEETVRKEVPEPCPVIENKSPSKEAPQTLSFYFNGDFKAMEQALLKCTVPLKRLKLSFNQVQEYVKYYENEKKTKTVFEKKRALRNKNICHLNKRRAVELGSRFVTRKRRRIIRKAHKCSKETKQIISTSSEESNEDSEIFREWIPIEVTGDLTVKGQLREYSGKSWGMDYKRRSSRMKRKPPVDYVSMEKGMDYAFSESDGTFYESESEQDEDSTIQVGKKQSPKQHGQEESCSSTIVHSSILTRQDLLETQNVRVGSSPPTSPVPILPKPCINIISGKQNNASFCSSSTSPTSIFSNKKQNDTSVSSSSNSSVLTVQKRDISGTQNPTPMSTSSPTPTHIISSKKLIGKRKALPGGSSSTSPVPILPAQCIISRKQNDTSARSSSTSPNSIHPKQNLQEKRYVPILPKQNLQEKRYVPILPKPILQESHHKQCEKEGSSEHCKEKAVPVGSLLQQLRLLQPKVNEQANTTEKHKPPLPKPIGVDLEVKSPDGVDIIFVDDDIDKRDIFGRNKIKQQNSDKLVTIQYPTGSNDMRANGVEKVQVNPSSGNFQSSDECDEIVVIADSRKPETSYSVDEGEVHYSSESDSDLFDEHSDVLSYMHHDKINKMHQLMKRHNEVTTYLLKYNNKFSTNELMNKTIHSCNECSGFKTNGVFRLYKHLMITHNLH